jgi:hypothetical protein
MDDVLQRNGYNQYQERIHRISKTLLSIERHTDCFVSRFSVEHKNDENVPKEIANFNSNNQLPKVEKSPGDKDKRNSVDDLNLQDVLGFIEDELCIKRLVEDSTLSSSSDESDDTREEKETKTKTITKDNMQKKFFNIELKLRGYLKEQNAKELFKFNAFDSIINESKLKTPISKLEPTSNTRCIIKNFFEDKDCIELAKKRMSMRDSQIEFLEKLNHQNLCKSNFDRLNLKGTEVKEERQRISNFGENEGDNVYTGNIGSPNRGSYNFAKRGSIFKEQNKRFSNAHLELDILNLASDKLLDVNEIESEESDSEN